MQVASYVHVGASCTVFRLFLDHGLGGIGLDQAFELELVIKQKFILLAKTQFCSWCSCCWIYRECRTDQVCRLRDVD
jgi:hypothetical protein